MLVICSEFSAFRKITGEFPNRSRTPGVLLVQPNQGST